MPSGLRKSVSEHHGDAPIREDGKEHIEVHVAGVCLRRKKEHWEVLIAKRSAKRSLYPGKWECGGGQVRRAETFQDAVRRQFFEEFGIDIQPQYVIEDYGIPVRNAMRVIPGLRFLVTASSESRVRLNKREFSAYRWVRFPVPKLPWIEGVKGCSTVLRRTFPTA
jgi:8-oxo-dGTP pyrophosphatase MutT (NUDIX family)